MMAAWGRSWVDRVDVFDWRWGSKVSCMAIPRSSNAPKSIAWLEWRPWCVDDSMTSWDVHRCPSLQSITIGTLCKEIVWDCHQQEAKLIAVSRAAASSANVSNGFVRKSGSLILDGSYFHNNVPRSNWSFGGIPRISQTLRHPKKIHPFDATCLSIHLHPQRRVQGTVKRSVDTHFIHANCDVDLIMEDWEDPGTTSHTH